VKGGPAPCGGEGERDRESGKGEKGKKKGLWMSRGMGRVRGRAKNQN